jgi:hypothetical protein
MSVLNPTNSEQILVKENAEYRSAFKARLKELIAEESSLSEQARWVYESLFPAWEKGAPKQESTIVFIRNRKKETIPYLKCRTCGKISDRVIELEDPMLFKEKRKTWKRIIKPSYNKHMYQGRQVRTKRVFWAQPLAECFRKKHKVSVKYLITTLKERGFTYKRGKI